MTTLGFGPHLVLDGYGCPYERLTDLPTVYKFLDECPDEIGMTKIMPPYVFKYSGKNPNDWGVSGFVLIAESHISVHTFPEKGYVSIDLFSCKRFDDQFVVETASKLFGIERFERQLLDRGREFPHDIIRSARIVADDRFRVTNEAVS